jgi:hypothetical protein
MSGAACDTGPLVKPPVVASTAPAKATPLVAAVPATAAVPVAAADPHALVLEHATASTPLVCVDALLATQMRPHQRTGVQFLWWRCNPPAHPDARRTRSPSPSPTAGAEAETGGEQADDWEAGGSARRATQGCILADEMGLGKSLQTLALVFTMLRRSPASATQPAIKKAVVVCPATLVGNWVREVRKWLGEHRLRPMGITRGGEEAASSIRDFLVSNNWPLLIISYDMARKYADLVRIFINPGILHICLRHHPQPIAAPFLFLCPSPCLSCSSARAHKKALYPSACSCATRPTSSRPPGAARPWTHSCPSHRKGACCLRARRCKTISVSVHDPDEYTCISVRCCLHPILVYL